MKPPTNADEHLFRDEELEVEAEVLEAEANQHEAKAEEIIQEKDVQRQIEINERKEELDEIEEKIRQFRPSEHYLEGTLDTLKFRRKTGRSFLAWSEERLGSDTGKSKRHKAKAAKLRNNATRLRARAAIHRRRAEGN